MALVVDPHNSGMASGSVGSMTATRNRSGAVMRRRVKPVRPNTPSQTEAKYAFNKMNRNFLDLSITNQALWNSFAANNATVNRLGQSIYNTGINWYIGFSSRLFRANVSIRTAPPLSAESDFFPGISLTQTAAGNPITIGFDQSFSLAKRVWVNATAALPKSRNFESKSMRLVTLIKNYVSLSSVTLIASPVFDTTVYQFRVFPVDEHGRKGTDTTYLVYPEDT